MYIRGHTLLWHRSLPLWVTRITSPTELESVVHEHIAAVVGRYKGVIYAWDVVNEIFTDEGGMRRNHFFEVLGERFVGIAFEAARKADGNAKLYINDYMTAKAKITGAVECIRRWRGAGMEIDGVGVQGHVSKGEAGRMGWTLKAFGNVVKEVCRGSNHGKDPADAILIGGDYGAGYCGCRGGRVCGGRAGLPGRRELCGNHELGCEGLGQLAS